MVDWIDLALSPDEASLTGMLDGLSADARAAAVAEISGRLGLTQDELERNMLRILVERVRTFALPPALWGRPTTAANEPRDHIRAHFGAIGVAETPERVEDAMRLYLAFADDRHKNPMTLARLTGCGFRCQHCGLAFHDDELEELDLESPFGRRTAPKVDALKPHWRAGLTAYDRRPTTDHQWPIKAYGSNAGHNLRVLCRPCNEAKADYMAVEQMKPFVGMAVRTALQFRTPVSPDTFYAQLRRFPICEETGRGPAEVELTVALRDPNLPAVLDNLRTIESADP